MYTVYKHASVEETSSPYGDFSVSPTKGWATTSATGRRGLRSQNRRHEVHLGTDFRISSTRLVQEPITLGRPPWQPFKCCATQFVQQSSQPRTISQHETLGLVLLPVIWVGLSYTRKSYGGMHFDQRQTEYLLKIIKRCILQDFPPRTFLEMQLTACISMMNASS